MISLRLHAGLLALAASALAAPSLAAQASSAGGRIVGRIIDARTGQGVSDAQIQVDSTRRGGLSGVNGRYTIVGVPAGTVTLHVRMLGYAPKSVTGVKVVAGQSVQQDVTLAAADVRLQAVVVTANAEKGSVSEALDAQRTAPSIVSAVTVEQISRSPDGDAAQAVQRVSGVSVQDGKFVFVRGLGERYTTTELNGARVPSPEPEKRVVPLDMFPSGLLQTITTTKTFTPDQQGDFSGALVDIKTREFPVRRTWSAVVNGGYVGNTTGDHMLAGLTTGGEQWAMVNSRRDLPRILAQLGSFHGLNLSHDDKNLIISQFRDAWTPKSITAPPIGSGSLSLGGNDPILFGHRLGYLISGTFSSGTDLRNDQFRALADRGNVKGTTKEIDRFTGNTATQSVLWGGLMNLSTLVGTNSRISLNGMYNRTSDNEARVERGSFENEGFPAQITRMDYVERGVQSLQLTGEHDFGRQQFDWAGTASRVTRDEPDRSEFVQQISQDSLGNELLLWHNTSNGGAVRTFAKLNERSSEGKANYQLSFSAFGREHSIKVGGLARSTNRTSDTRAYAIEAPGASMAIRALPPEQIFDGRFSQPGDSVFDIAPLSEGGSYTADDKLSAGYAMTTLQLSSRLRLIGGARYESDKVTIDAFSTLGAPVSTTKNWNDLLPALALDYKLGEFQQVRLSASKTLARPEYRELSPITGRDVLNGDDTQGNDQLVRTNIQNFDARWEWYPNADEVISVAAFVKQFDHPIERVYLASGSGTRLVFYTNAKSASNYGLEIELRKNLAFIMRSLSAFTLFSNVTLMHSEISLDSASKASATNLKRRMVGQAPYVINVGLGYVNGSGSTSATLLFNRIGDRIDAAGDNPLPDVVELGRNVLDFSLRFPLAGDMSGRLDAKNLLDAPYQTIQGTVTREYYRAGRTVQLGIVWRP